MDSAFKLTGSSPAIPASNRRIKNRLFFVALAKNRAFSRLFGFAVFGR
jgi:hypothetical protein